VYHQQSKNLLAHTLQDQRLSNRSRVACHHALSVHP
jgi:hypothetical protein